MRKPKRKPQAWRVWRKRALQAETQLEAWRVWRKRALQAETQLAVVESLFQEKTGISITEYVMYKWGNLWASSPRHGTIITNVEVPVA